MGPDVLVEIVAEEEEVLLMTLAEDSFLGETFALVDFSTLAVLALWATFFP